MGVEVFIPDKAQFDRKKAQRLCPKIFEPFLSVISLGMVTQQCGEVGSPTNTQSTNTKP